MSRSRSRRIFKTSAATRSPCWKTISRAATSSCISSARWRARRQRRRSVDDLLRRRPELAARLAEKGMDREALGRLTYTQWEAWLAIGFNKDGARKNLVIVTPAVGVKRGAKFAPTDASRASQADHLARLKAIDFYPAKPFTSADNLVARVFGSVVLDALEKARIGHEAPQSSLRIARRPVRRPRRGPCRPAYGAARRQGRSGRASRSRGDRQDAARDRICMVSRGGLFGAPVRQRERRRRAQRGSGGADGASKFSTCQRKRRATTRPRSPPSCAGSKPTRLGS